VNQPAIEHGAAQRRVPADRVGVAQALEVGERAVLGDQAVTVAVHQVNQRVRGLAQPGRGAGDRAEDRRQPARPGDGTPGTHRQHSMPPPTDA
jgi:hypothetical protein